MQRIDTSLPGVYLIEPDVWRDERGFFFESYNRAALAELGLDVEFVQDNVSHSFEGVLRGLHYQLQQPQAKLVRCLRGAVHDVVVDIRQGSPSFGQWFSCELSEENNHQIFIPVGFAHGFYTLSEKAEVHYKCSDYYHPPGERGILWNDPGLAIDWPLSSPEPIISSKDLNALTLSQISADDLPAFEA